MISAAMSRSNGWFVRPYMHNHRLVSRLCHGNFVDAAKHDDRRVFLINGDRWQSMRALNTYCEFSSLLSSRYHLLRNGSTGDSLDDYFALTESLDLEYDALSDGQQRVMTKELHRLARPLAEIVDEIQMIDLGGFAAIRKLDLLDGSANVAKTLLGHLHKDWWRAIR